MDSLQKYSHKPLTVCGKYNYHSEYCHESMNAGIKITVRECITKELCKACIEETD